MKQHGNKKTIAARFSVALLAASLSASAWALAPVNPNLTPEAREVLNYLSSKYGTNHISGTHLFDGVANSYMSVGRRGVIWMDNMEWMTLARADIMIADYKKYRPIFCFNWHWQLGDMWGYMGNPLYPTNGFPYNQPLKVARVLNPATPEYALMITDLNAAVAVFKKFQTNGVPILWRGMHENGGGWFWWSDHVTPENTAALWRFTYDYFKTNGVNNLIWYYNAGQCLGSDMNFRKQFYPGNAYADFVDVNMYDSDHTYDVAGQTWYFNLMTYITGGAKMIGGGDQPVPQPADYMEEGRFPKWLLGTPWEGAPYPSRGFSARRARYHYNHPFVISLDEAPVFGAGLNQPILYPNVFPEVGIVSPEIQTWTYDSTPVIEAFAKDRDGSVSKVELYAQDIVNGSTQKIATLTSGTNGLYRFHWSNMTNGFYKVSAVATDNSGNVSASTNMGACSDQWKNWVWITKGYHNIAKNRPATASSSSGANLPSRATDDNYEIGWESAFTDNAWLSVDLGAAYSISQVNLRWGWCAYADTFQILVSTNGSTWTQVYTKSGFRGETKWASVSVCTFPARNARYVKFNGTLQSGNNARYFGYKLAEIEVPVPLTAVPSTTAKYLDLHNRAPMWCRSFDRTVYGTPGSVVAAGAYTSYARDYFDSVGEQLCGKVTCATGYSKFSLYPYDNTTARNLSAFSAGNIHFAARASVATTWQLLIGDTNRVPVIRALSLTTNWQEFDVPVSEVTNKLVNLASVREPFIIQKNDSACNLYLRDVYWSTKPRVAPATNIVTDGSFDATDAAFPTARSVNAFDENHPYLGWYAGAFSTMVPVWQRDATNNWANVITPPLYCRAPGLAQIIADQRATTGKRQFTFYAKNIEGGGTPNVSNELTVAVFGVFGYKESCWSMELVYEDAVYGIGPENNVGPVGELLASPYEIHGTNFDGVVTKEIDFGAGYDNIVILFWSKNVDTTKGDVQRVDDVRIEPIRGTVSPVVNGDFSQAFVTLPNYWINNTTHTGVGWVAQSNQTKWTRSTDGYATVANRGGYGAISQIINASGVTSARNFSMRAKNSVASGTNTTWLKVWGVRGSLQVMTIDQSGPFNSSYQPVGDLLYTKDIGASVYDWSTFIGSVNLGTGYDYLVIKIYSNGGSGVTAVDDVQIE